MQQKYEAKNVPTESLANTIMQNYFTAQYIVPQSISEMFDDIFLVYTRLEAEMKWDTMYDLATRCIAFDRWPQDILEHRLLTTMRTFIARYEQLKAQGRIK